MLISYSWLQDFIQEPLPAPEELAKRLVEHSFEVDDHYPVGLKHPGIVVGYVKKAEPHPNADRLSLCTVDLGSSEPVKIVCGGKNVATGQWVPVATVGTTLANGLKIEAAVIRGIASNGMICSPEELGEPGTGKKHIKVLEGQLTAGELYDRYQETGVDHVFDIDVLPNRAPDCLSHRGIAREIAAIFELTFKDNVEQLQSTKTESNKLTVDIQDPKRCRHYIGTLMTGLQVNDSPPWLQNRLRAVGLRPINNIVDATNYIMYSLGQPLHAFDANKLQTDPNQQYRIGVRSAKPKETITALDEQGYNLPESATVITDENNSGRPIAIAGVMGGLESAVTESTTEVILEAAIFDPILTRQSSRDLKLLSDSSKRFENGVSSVLTAMAMPALVKLLQDLAGTQETQVVEIVDQYPDSDSRLDQSSEIELSLDDINKLLGSRITAEEVKMILQRLQFSIKRSGSKLSVSPPADRLDIAIKADVIEEVGRIYGHNRIQAAELPPATQPAEINHRFYWTHRIRDILSGLGWSEVMTYTLRAEGELELANPLATDKAFFRDQLNTGLAEALEKNTRFLDLLGQDLVRIYEIGTVYQAGQEQLKLALAAGEKKALSQTEVEAAVTELRDRLSVKLPENELSKPGLFEIELEPVLKELPKVNSYSDLKDLDQLIKYRSISVYPYCLRDVALWVPNSVTPSQVSQVITQHGTELLVNQYLFDRYQKDKQTSYAFRLVFQAPDRTLSDREVNRITDSIYAALNAQPQWETR